MHLEMCMLQRHVFPQLNVISSGLFIEEALLQQLCGNKALSELLGKFQVSLLIPST